MFTCTDEWIEAFWILPKAVRATVIVKTVFPKAFTKIGQITDFLAPQLQRVVISMQETFFPLPIFLRYQM